MDVAVHLEIDTKILELNVGVLFQRGAEIHIVKISEGCFRFKLDTDLQILKIGEVRVPFK